MEKLNRAHKHNQLLKPCGAIMPRVNDVTSIHIVHVLVIYIAHPKSDVMHVSLDSNL